MTSVYSPPSFANVAFNPTGVEVVAQHLLRDPVFARCERQARAMAFAYFAAGAHQDGQHKLNNKFHPSYRTYRGGGQQDQDTKKVATKTRQDYMCFVLDALTLWDRFTGGASVMVHTNGTRRPNVPVTPTEIALDVYAPPSIIDSLPEAPFSLARIVQEFAQGIALDTVARWDRLTNKDGWSSSDIAADPLPVCPSLLPTTSTTRFVFYGRAWGTLEPLIEQYLLTRRTGTWSVYLPPPSLPCAPPLPTSLNAAVPPISSLPVPPSNKTAEPACVSSTSSGPVPCPPPSTPVRLLPPPPSLRASHKGKGKGTAAVENPTDEPGWEEYCKHSFESVAYLEELHALKEKLRSAELENYNYGLQIEEHKAEIAVCREELAGCKEDIAIKLERIFELKKQNEALTTPRHAVLRDLLLSVGGTLPLPRIPGHFVLM
ncbi:hypothetical protein C8Q73DRAFT_52167 [Cubamyces lactineus]|nr:hypothetical protein C8Q73DRAFT_52167 [Cubamyces lactineus]